MSAVFIAQFAMHRIAFEIKLLIHYAVSLQSVNQFSNVVFCARVISSFLSSQSHSLLLYFFAV